MIRAIILRPGSVDLVGVLTAVIEFSKQSWKDSRIIPFYLTLLSAFVLLLHLAGHYGSKRAAKPDNLKIVTDDDAKQSKFEQHVASLGGTTIFCFMIARVIGCFTLFGISSVSLFARWKHVVWESHTMVAVYLYASLLAVASVVALRWSSALTRHNILLLLATFVVYGYRDLWQLVTYTEEHIDASEGWVLWAEIMTLALTSICVPLLIPRRYVPVDKAEPMVKPNPEQTASLFSFFLYIYLDPIIVKANTMPHLPSSELPPLGDYDYAKNIVKQSFPHIDTFSGAKSRHIFFGLMHAFRYDFFMVTIASSLRILCTFASPIGINRILAYIEAKGSGAIVRPWFWIIWLFVGPIMTSLCQNMYLYLTSWILVRAEALITHLLFEHSLRIRLKADALDSSAIGQVIEQGGKNKTGYLTGKINNLVTSDLNNIGQARDFLEIVYAIPVQVVLCMVFIYSILGWSAFAGLATIIILFPIPGLITREIERVQVKGMGRTDARVELVTETINVLRMIKLFGWEPKTNEKIDEKRRDELKWIWKRKLLEMSNNITNYLILSVTTLVTYGTFTIIMKRDLSASIVFSSMSVFDILRSQLHSTFFFLSSMVQAKVSLDRVNDFLHDTELLDVYAEKVDPQISHGHEQDLEGVIGFKDASFTWSAETNGSATPSQRSFKLQIQGELFFQRNCINLIVGPTGSGKTSILMALLGEMHFIPMTTSSWISLPRAGGVAYAAQESWVQSDTIRNNITFGSPYDEVRYKQVLYQCALEQDLLLFEAGDQTEVGERGLTLSGGQKARMTLARAIYSSAEIILLDDVLAALDVHTSRWVVDNCLRGDLVQGRTVLLVTHNVVLASPIADFVVAVDIDGNVCSQGSGISAASLHDSLLAPEAQQEVMEKKSEKPDQPSREPGAGKLVIAEEIAQGRVSRKAMSIFFSALSDGHPTLFLLLWNFGTILVGASTNFQVWYLGYWGSQYDTRPSSEISVSYYLTVYTIILFVMVVIYATTTVYFMYASMKASRQIHKQLISSLLGTTFRWLDETPTSRVIARCTQDIQAVDGPIPETFANVFYAAITLLFRIGGIMIFTPLFVFPGLVVAAIGLYISNVYLKAQLSIKREMSNAKSPVLSHFGATIAGLVSIRAYGAQQMFKKESLKRLDHFILVSRTSYNVNRWIGVRLNVLGASLTSSLAAYLVYGSTGNPANIGFSLTMAADICLTVLWWVQVFNEFEVQSNSLERIKGYLEIEQEPKPQEQNKPPAAWPTSGKLIVENLSARYSQTGPEVLHDISFQVNAGERIGIVGRTGSGKSSLTLSLLRSIPTDGSVYYDDLPTKDINLDALRLNITIIPQMPELLGGTLRRNLDPFEQYDDATLNDALRAAGLTTLQDEAGEGRLTLDSSISSTGGNLSVGQRQIIALARAIVRRSKLLILDEATSAIDYNTDTVIQTTLRNELPSDVTVITVAHRLQTIMDADKIMVLDSGKIVEFDSPKILLNKPSGMLKSLVDNSDDKTALYAMAIGT